MENKFDPRAWLFQHGHKVLIWVMFLASLLDWVLNNPDPQNLLEALDACTGS